MGHDDEVDARGVYDAMAAAYVADEGNAYNSLYERSSATSPTLRWRGSRMRRSTRSPRR
jgi:hypothetical protein